MIKVAMMANNPENDEYDPNLEEGGEEFSYDEESFEDSEFSEEENWDEEGFEEEAGEDAGEEEPAEKPAKQKKKGGLFNVIIILLALVGGGGFIYLKILSPGTATPPAEQTAQAPAEPAPEQVASTPEPAPLPEAEPAPAQPAEQTELALTPEPLTPATQEPAPALVAEPALSDAPPALAETPAAETPVAEPAPALAPALAPTPEQAPVQPVEMASAPPMPAPIAPPSGGFGGSLPKANDIMLNQNDVPAAAAPAVSDESLRGIEQKLSVLLARLDTFEGRITSLESGVHQMSSEVTTLKAKPAPTADLSSVNEAIKGLEGKISALGQPTPAAASASVKQDAIPTPAAPADIADIDQPTFVPAPEAEPESEPAPAPKTVISAVDTPKKEETAVTATPVLKAASAAEKVTSWVLRSAQPGTAMVAPKAGGDMRSVKVGDTLSGVGRIVAIEKTGSQWVVRGTSGTITR